MSVRAITVTTSPVPCATWCPPACVHAGQSQPVRCTLWCPPECVHKVTWCYGCGLPGHRNSLDVLCPMHVPLDDPTYCRMHDLYDCPYAHGPR